ncbi:hypothetical protein TH53_12735 [Pedobacter lusitanus]|uniref:Erythromycin esterase n=1 Tax=Pedobacter lusitanus TaxID=1503925 RepID=A0A0D0GQG8_9SPHI|nr:erythromycin esterase family protein [Pedobacter lusitanus]KIO76786.1 hypothetical protein TH53_12735 [Pedobacter lusitanus]
MKNKYLNNYRKVLILIFMLFSYSASGQDSINWINKNAQELNSDLPLNISDLDFLKTELANKTIIGLGEASHGTHEFYILKAQVISYLVSKVDFNLIAFEVPQSIMAPINSYLQTGEGNLKELMKDLALYSTEEIYNSLLWLRQYNISKPNNKVILIGLDHEDYWSNPITRDKFMAENLIKSSDSERKKAIVWTHNAHLQKDSVSLSMGSYLKRQLGDQFYAIGFDTYQGTVNVLKDGKFETHIFKAEENSFSHMLAQTKYSSFFLPFHKGNPFNGVTGFITNIYSDWREPKPLSIKIGVDFDSILFIRNTTHSIKLPID